MSQLETLVNSLLLAFAVLLMICIMLLIWATTLFIQVHSMLARLHRLLGASVRREPISSKAD